MPNVSVEQVPWKRFNKNGLKAEAAIGGVEFRINKGPCEEILETW